MPKRKNSFREFIRNPFKSLVAIYIITFISFSNIFKNQFILDDFSFIVDWPLIKDLKNLPQFFVGYVPPPGQEGIYAPLKTLFHAIAFHLFSYNVVGYHILSLLVHFLMIFFVYKIVEHLTRDDVITFFTTILFALHPVHCEAITSMTASIDTIGTVFMFAAFYFYIRQGKKDIALKNKKYFVSLGFCLLAIATQELTAALPFLIVLYDVCLNSVQFRKKEIIQRVLPFILVIGLYLGCKYLVLGGISRGQYIYDSFYLTMLVSIKALAKYIFIMFFPVVLTHNHVISQGIYSFDVKDFDEYAVITQSIFDVQVVISLFVILGVIYAAVRCWKSRPLMSFAIGWFLLSLLPAMNLIPSSVYFAERYLYIPSFGFCLLLGVYFARLYSAKGAIGKLRYAHIGLALVLIISLAFGFRLWTRNRELRTDITLFRSAIRANPKSALMRNDLGIVYTQYNQLDRALESFQQALALKEEPVTYFAMAEAYAQMGQNEKSEEFLRKAIKLKPDFADAYYNLASLYAFWAKMEEAQTYLDQAMSLYEEKGETEKAQRYKQIFNEYFGQKM